MNSSHGTGTGTGQLGAMNDMDYDFETSDEYEDFIALKLLEHGFVLVNFKSRKFQFSHGENSLGLEIKLDRKMQATGNVYIETDEKSHPDLPEYVRSGIHREDNSWLYGIGDRGEFYIFSKRFLKRLDRTVPAIGEGDYRGICRVENTTKTSLGFLLPRAMAREFCERHFVWEE